MRRIVLTGCLAFLFACGGGAGGTGGGAGGSAGGGTGGTGGGATGGGTGGATGGGTGGATGGGTGGGATGGGTGGATGGGTGGATGGGTGGATGGGTGGGTAFDGGSVQSDFLFSTNPQTTVSALGLAVSANRVLVGNGRLLHSFNGVPDGGFTTLQISDAGVGDITRVVIDAQGRAHVVLRDDSSNGYVLFHAYELEDGGFAREQIEDGGRVGNPAYDMRIAPDGTIHVAYYISNVAPLDGGTRSDVAFRHAQLTPTGWAVELIKRTGNYVSANPALINPGYRLALAIDSSGEPVVAFQDEYVGTALDGGGVQATVATRSGGIGGTWALETVGPPAPSGFNQLQIDANPVAGKPIQAAMVQLQGTPTYWAKTSSGWKNLGYDAGYPQFAATPAVRFTPQGDGWFYAVSQVSPFQGNLVGFEVTTTAAPFAYLLGKPTGTGFGFRSNSALFLPVTYAPGDPRPHWITIESDSNPNYRYSYSTRK